MKGFKTGAQTGGLSEAGEAMGFMKGGQVKKNPESPQFRMKTEKTGNKSDHGNMPKTEGDNEQMKEAGGRGKVRPGYMKGGHVADGYRKVMQGGAVHYMKGGKAYVMKGGKMVGKANKVATNTKGQGEAVKPAGRGATSVSKTGGGSSGTRRKSPYGGRGRKGYGK